MECGKIFNDYSYNLVPNERRILDIGCGSGEFSRRLSKRKNVLVWGVDVNEENINICKGKKTPVNYLKISAEDLDFPDNFFDEIYMNEVMEHVENTAIVLGKIKRMLKKGGKFVISVPCKQSEDKLLKINKDYWNEIGHKRAFLKKELLNFLESQNFKISKYKSYNSCEYLFWKRYFKKRKKIYNQNAKTDKISFYEKIMTETLNQDNFYIYYEPSIKNYTFLSLKIMFYPLSRLLDLFVLNKKQRVVSINIK